MPVRGSWRERLTRPVEHGSIVGAATMRGHTPEELCRLGDASRGNAVHAGTMLDQFRAHGLASRVPPFVSTQTCTKEWSSRARKIGRAPCRAREGQEG